MDRRDLGWAAALGALALALYLALGQERIYGDGTGLVDFAHRGGNRAFHHVLYLPVAGWFAGLVPGGHDLLVGPRLASQIPAALGVAGCFLLLRALGLGRRGAGLGAALTGLAPPWLFFATAVEVHALHGGLAPWVFLAVLRAPWRSIGLGFGVTALGLVLLYGTHQSGALLGPTLVVLAGLGARAAGRPFSVRGLWLGLAPALFAVLVGALSLASLLRFGDPNPLRELTGAQELAEGAALGVTSDMSGRVLNALRSLACLGPLALVGLWKLPKVAWALVATSIGLGGLVVVLWGVVERGGYFLAYLPFLAWPAAAALERLPLRLRWAALALVLVQGALAFQALWEFDRGWRLEDRRLALVEAMGPGEPRGDLVTLVALAPPATLWWPSLRERLVGQTIVGALVAGARDEDAAAATASLSVLLSDEPLVVDATVHEHPQLVASPRLKAALAAAYASIQERFEYVSVARGGWVFWRIHGPRSAADDAE